MRIISQLAVVLSLTSIVYGAEPDPPRHYLIKLKIYEETKMANGEVRRETLSKPQLITIDGQACSFQVGGRSLRPQVDQNAEEFTETGIQGEIQCTHIDEQSVRLDLKLRQQQVTEDQPERFVVSDVGKRVLFKAKLNTAVNTVLQVKEKSSLLFEVQVEEAPIKVLR